MNAAGLHPALGKMLRYRMFATVRRRWRSLRDRSNLVSTAMVIALGCVWLCGVVAATAFRETLPINRLRGAIVNGMLMYSLWLLIRTALWKPVRDFSWTSEERGSLLAGPFSRSQLLIYHFAGTAMTAVVKAGGVCLILIRDLPNPLTGFTGVLLAIAFLDSLRMSLNVAGHGAGRCAFALFRGAVLAACCWLAVCLATAIAADISGSGTETAVPAARLQEAVSHAVEGLRDSRPLRIAAAPCLVFGRLATAPADLDFELLRSTVGAFGLVVIGFTVVFQLDARFESVRLRRERSTAEVRDGGVPSKRSRAVTAPLHCRRIRYFAGAGPIVWRQWTSAKRRWGELLAVCLVPAVASLTPLLVRVEGIETVYLVGVLIGLLTMLLLAPSVTYDFRRDYSRLHLLKSLPLRPTAVVLGQACIPVLLASAMQLAALTVCVLFEPSPATAGRATATLFVLLPWNTFVFGLENLIFLRDPHPEDRNGVEMFVRTTLVFTAKSLLLAFGLFALILWSSWTRSLCHTLHVFGPPMDYETVCGLGVWLAVVLAACGCVWMLRRAFLRLDVRAGDDH